MKKVALVLCVLFIIITFAGAGYVLFGGVNANAGYTVVPMIFALASLAVYRAQKKR